MKKKKFWSMVKASETEANIDILGEIVPTGWEWDGDTSAHSFKQDLDNLGGITTINLHINSPGGSVFDGVAIGTMLKNHKAQVNVYVDGYAASIASVIAMSGNTIYMPKNTMLMLHNPWTRVTGNAEELRKQADDLDKIGLSMRESYLMKADESLSEETLEKLLKEETWLSAQEAYDYGMCDVILEENKVAACVSDEHMGLFKHVPKNLIKENETEQKPEKTILQKKLELIR